MNTKKLNNDAMIKLANAIVVQACKDYRSVIKRVDAINKRAREQREGEDYIDTCKRRYDSMKSALYDKKDIEKFLKSEYCYGLCGADGRFLIEQIKIKQRGKHL